MEIRLGLNREIWKNVTRGAVGRDLRQLIDLQIIITAVLSSVKPRLSRRFRYTQKCRTSIRDILTLAEVLHL